MQSPGPHLQRFWFYGSRVKPRFLYFSSVAKGLWWISLRNHHLHLFFFLNLWEPGGDRLRSGWGLTVRSSALPQHAPHLPSIPILWHGQFVLPQFYGKVLRRCIFKGAPCLFLWSNEHPSGRAPLKLWSPLWMGMEAQHLRKRTYKVWGDEGSKHTPYQSGQEKGQFEKDTWWRACWWMAGLVDVQISVKVFFPFCN